MFCAPQKEPDKGPTVIEVAPEFIFFPDILINPPEEPASHPHDTDDANSATKSPVPLPLLLFCIVREIGPYTAMASPVPRVKSELQEIATTRYSLFANMV